MKKIYFDFEKEDGRHLRQAALYVLIAGIVFYVAMIISQSIVADVYVSSTGYVRDNGYEFKFSWVSLFTFLPVLVGSYFFYALGNCIASITKNVYIQKEITVDTINKDEFEIVTQQEDNN
ncbi:MAG: hypothetical protein LBG15_07205 [Dysgonamonadaceae bacterium]|jgi:hypothetical protein|nr:hypothetical protein [Dysgonamonadaceae bacterium]